MYDFMTITLEKATKEDAETLHALQIKCFLPLLDKYKDHGTNPACEPIDKTLTRITDPLKGFYKILKDNILVGGIVVKHTNPGTLFLGPIFIDPEFQNQKIAQKALKLIEDVFPTIDFFELATIAEEKRNVYLYEKMGYIATEENKKISDSMIIPFFRKKVIRS
jgi:GNAT superfamily N-acetyltransferase